MAYRAWRDSLPDIAVVAARLPGVSRALASRPCKP
jgi:surfactin synthase thioesterase subunit